MKTKYDSPLVPQIEENIQKAEWKTKEEIPRILEYAYENIKIIIDEVIK
jgi:hypothetical protein